MYGTGRGGLSGEHIQLCAEGARRRPNLSGERTEIADRQVMRFFWAVLRGLSFLFVIIRNEVKIYAWKDFGFN